MRYAKLTLTIAFEDYGSDACTPLDAVLPVLDDHLPSEVVVLDYDEAPLQLVPVPERATISTAEEYVAAVAYSQEEA